MSKESTHEIDESPVVYKHSPTFRSESKRYLAITIIYGAYYMLLHVSLLSFCVDGIR